MRLQPFTLNKFVSKYCEENAFKTKCSIIEVIFVFLKSANVITSFNIEVTRA